MKKILIILGILILILGASVGGVFVYYNNTLKETHGNSNEPVTLIINQGTSSKGVIDIIYNAGLLKNKYVGYVYIKQHNINNLQAGEYEVNKGMTFTEILEKISSGETVDRSFSVTFVEGKRLTYFVNVISKNFPYTEEEIHDLLENKDYLQSLIDKHWFLTDEILNDKLYYALEGYLYPSTYYFDVDTSLEDIIDKLLSQMGKELSNYKDEIENSEYTVHELLTMASIVELEAGINVASYRPGVAGVFYNRLNSNQSLGSDVTTYYAAQIDMGERDLYQYEIDDINDYNTRPLSKIGLPVGPISNPSASSIKAAIEPEENDYFFFVADIKGTVHFTKTNAEHEAKIAELKRDGLWYVYS